ncbi:MAG: Re/Si-specific NAD(P)(+) transhydrogenase subunit alpha [Candidatus Sericytochromatia bacterium]|nr:Re/Si-specific NAD(P)(+) transhydrogenase subunit alpha [Candidatus Sericytochromatia bacterium]
MSMLSRLAGRQCSRFNSWPAGTRMAMQLVVPAELLPDECRVAATPETVKGWISQGHVVAVESGAGARAGVPDEAYRQAGASISEDLLAELARADVVLKVRRPLGGEGALRDEISAMREGSTLLAVMEPWQHGKELLALARRHIVSYGLELVPRISRAQSMDVLSSQANLAGYKAVLDAAAHFGRAFPMMMTAAGTIAPARVFVMGAGVAGLQAIATARRLGAVVAATDVRLAAKEQVESLGATFVMVASEESAKAETTGGYAQEMSEDYRQRQAELVAQTLRKTDIVITTALVPGKRAPLLVSEEMLDLLRPGSVIVDLAADAGGNCAGTVPGEVVSRGGVTIVGHRNMPSRLPIDASALFARNIRHFMDLLMDKESGTPRNTSEDEILVASRLTEGGRIVQDRFSPSPVT